MLPPPKSRKVFLEYEGQMSCQPAVSCYWRVTQVTDVSEGAGSKPPYPAAARHMHPVLYEWWYGENFCLETRFTGKA
jgi:hypothetical protein